MDWREPHRASPDDWRDSRDIERTPGEGWSPRYFRCTNPRCLSLVTDGQIKLGGCVCGTPRLMPAGTLDTEEILRLQQGGYPLTQREYDLVQPETDCVVTTIVD